MSSWESSPLEEMEDMSSNSFVFMAWITDDDTHGIATLQQKWKNCVRVHYENNKLKVLTRQTIANTIHHSHMIICLTEINN